MSDPATSPAKNRVFLSYSRSEMYYAEAITSGLQEVGFDIWFDLQQLEPGCVWVEDIERGLNETDELVLIVSRTALASRWVAKEWQHAMDQGHQIHLVIFEEVHRDGYSYIDKEDNVVPIDTQRLFDYATSIIDGRARFQTVIDQLTRAIQGDEAPRHRIPAPNPLKIPMRLPFMVGFTALTMFFIPIFWLRFTLLALPLSTPVALGAGIITLLSALEFRHFITRESFRGTRMTLFAMMVASLMVTSPLFFVFMIAWLASIFSLSVNLWSPRGEGLRRGETSNRQMVIRTIHNIVPMYIESSIVIKLAFYSVVFFIGMVIAVPFVSEDAIFLIALIITLGVVAVISTVIHLYKKRTSKPDVQQSDKIFRIIYSVADTRIAETVSQSMDKAGHTRVTSSDEFTDFNIVIATNFLQQSDVASYIGQPGRWIILVAANLQDKDWFLDFRDFQWVDYRKHDRQHLEAMVDELRENKLDAVSHNFSTRTTPQSFSKKIVLPQYVQSFVFWVLFIVNSVLAFGAALLPAVLEPSDPTIDTESGYQIFVMIIFFLFFILPNLIVISLVVRIMLRDMTVPRLIWRTRIAIALLMLMNPPSILAFVFLYFVVANRIHHSLNEWLPEIDTQQKEHIVVPKITWGQTLPLYARSIAIAVVIMILTTSLALSGAAFEIIVNQALFRG